MRSCSSFPADFKSLLASQTFQEATVTHMPCQNRSRKNRRIKNSSTSEVKAMVKAQDHIHLGVWCSSYLPHSGSGPCRFAPFCQLRSVWLPVELSCEAKASRARHFEMVYYRDRSGLALCNTIHQQFMEQFMAPHHTTRYSIIFHHVV